MAALPSSQAAQAGLAVALARQISPALPGLDLTDSTVFAQFAAWLTQLVQRFGQASATLAVRQYAADRTAAGVGGAFTPRPASPAGLDQVSATLGWATAPLRDPQAPPQTITPAAVEQRITVGAEKLVLDVGRQTIIDNTLTDRKAKGWARVTEPDACSFCLLLATRGAVYKDADTAGRNSNKKFTGTGEFKTHDNCRCHAEPVFNVYEPSAQIREAEALYRSSTKGLSSGDARNAFRRAVESQRSN